MEFNPFPTSAMRVVAVLLSLLLLAPGIAFAQAQPPALPPPDQALSPDQLDDLVAPVALLLG